MSKIFQTLIRRIDERLIEEEHDCELRFTLIVWCGCSDVPVFVGGNGGNDARTLQMLHKAADLVLDQHEHMEGHA